MRVLILGCKGQIGSALKNVFESDLFFEIHSLSKEELDLRDLKQISPKLCEIKPEIIINAAAFTDVERAEKEFQNAFMINAAAPGEIASWCNKNDALFVHYSTDYVFSGKSDQPYSESDHTFPLNAYGHTKLEGERLIAENTQRWIILRTSWLYSKSGKNFVNTILNAAKNRRVLKVVNDQFGSPTYAPDVAVKTYELIKKIIVLKDFKSGIYHMSNLGTTNWYEFASEILKNENVTINPISSEEYPSEVMRPQFSSLANNKLAEEFGIQLRAWEEALADFRGQL